MTDYAPQIDNGFYGPDHVRWELIRLVGDVIGQLSDRFGIAVAAAVLEGFPQEVRCRLRAVPIRSRFSS